MGTEFIGGYGPIDNKIRDNCDILVARLHRSIAVISDRTSTHCHSSVPYNVAKAFGVIKDDHAVRITVELEKGDLRSITFALDEVGVAGATTVDYLQLTRETCGYDVKFVFDTGSWPRGK